MLNKCLIYYFCEDVYLASFTSPCLYTITFFYDQGQQKRENENSYRDL